MPLGALTTALAGAALTPESPTSMGLAPLPPDTLNYRNAINVAPVGANLGAMLLPYNSGSPQNGGQPISYPVNFSTPYSSGNIGVPGASNNTGIITLAGVALALAGLVAFIRRR